MKKIFCIGMLAALMLSLTGGAAGAREVKFEASVDASSIAIGEQAQLGLTFYGTQEMPAPDLGSIDGLDIRYLGPSTMVTVINGKMSSSITHRYAVVPLKTGKFQLGPFSFNYKGDAYKSSIVFIGVGEERGPKEERREEDVVAGLDLSERLFLTLRVDKTTAYVNELIPVTVKLYVNRLNVSDIQLPSFEQEGFSRVDFKEPKQYREELGGEAYDVLEFKTKIFGTRPGDYSLGPAKIRCNLVVKRRQRRMPSRADDFFGDEFFDEPHFENFFARYERHPLELKSEDAPLVISPLPQGGKPGDFQGAIGDYQFIYNASPAAVKVGDPVTLKMEINGTGNFNTVLIPRLDDTEGFKVYEPQVKTEENRKTFTQVLIPETANARQVPKATFLYFDPNKSEYKKIVQGPIPLTVEPSKDPSPARVVGPAPASIPYRADAEELKRDIIYIKETLGDVKRKGGEVYRSVAAAALLPIPLILLGFVYVFYARSARLRRDMKYSRRLAAFASAKRGLQTLKGHLRGEAKGIFYKTAFDILQKIMGGALNMPPAGMTFDAADPALEAKEIDREIRAKVKNLFDAFDRARFGFFEADELRMKDDLKDLERVFRYFERVKR